MQTFIVCRNFKKNARYLDKKRLFKQLVETRQILATNGVKIYKVDGTLMKSTHVHHPIHKIWKDHIECLKYYHNCLLEECLSPRRKINTTILPLEVDLNNLTYPPIIRKEKFLAGQRSNLLRKDPEYYSQFGWKEKNNLPYIWE